MTRKNVHTPSSTFIRFLVYITCAVLVSCTLPDKSDLDRLNSSIDRDTKMTREEFREQLLPKPEPKEEKAEEPSIPEISDILTTPAKPDGMPDKLISLSVTEDIPLKDVLIELARLADIDMEVDPSISGGIILRVKDKPFKEVISRVSNQAGLRYKLEDGVLRIQRDTPYKVDYRVDFLNMTRTNESSINIDTQGLGGGGDTELPSGSTNAISLKSDGDVWESVEEAINNMLNFTQATGLAVGEGGEASAGGGTSLQINRPAGMISVIANERQHTIIDEYLEVVEEQMSAQVLIEAKVVEVTLDDEYRSGIDWGTLQDQSLNISAAGNFPGGIGTSSDFFTIGAYNAKNLSAAVSLTDAFGVSRTLSSPRLHAMNNQQAVLSFAENSVYFDLQVQEETDDSGAAENTTLTVESELRTVPVGVILTLQPSINLKSREITMHVRPTLSRITGTVQDPGVDIIVARQTGDNPINITSDIPVIEVRELDSILKIKSGEIMVIGGLMKNVETTDEKGIPFLNRTPLVGNLFKSKVQTSEVVETVIFIKATIIASASKIEKGDQHLYKTFAPRDPRPLAF